MEQGTPYPRHLQHEYTPQADSESEADVTKIPSAAVVPAPPNDTHRMVPMPGHQATIPSSKQTSTSLNYDSLSLRGQNPFSFFVNSPPLPHTILPVIVHMSGEFEGIIESKIPLK